MRFGVEKYQISKSMRKKERRKMVNTRAQEVDWMLKGSKKKVGAVGRVRSILMANERGTRET